MERKPRAFWEQLIAEFEESGGQHRAFARRAGVKLGTFQHWLYRLRRERAGQPVRLLPVRVAEASAPAGGPGVELAAAGVVLRFQPGVDARFVARLVVELEERRC